MTRPAFLSLWNDIATERIPEYDRWHTLEHVPERVWVPGFIAGSRYVGDAPGQARYFSLYELQDLACLESPEYRQLVEQPTPWSASMRLSFSGFLRKTGPELARAGCVQGSAIQVLRWVWPAGQGPSAPDWARCLQLCLPAASQAGASRLRIQQVLPSGPQALKNEDPAPAGDEFLGLLELYDGAQAPALARIVQAAVQALVTQAPVWSHASSYRFASRVLHADVAAPQRPAPRLDLMPR